MARTHVTWDFSEGPDGVAVETPFTPEEEAAADAELAAAQAVVQVVEEPPAQQLLADIAESVAKLRAMGINV